MRHWIPFLLLSCAAPAPEQVPTPPTGWIDDEAYPISRTWVFAQDNENTKWTLVFASRRAFPAHFGGDLRTAHVDFAGESHAVRGIGGSPAGAYFQFDTDREDAAACAKRLGVEAHARVDPKLVLRSRLVPVAAQTSGSAPQTAQFVLENAGASPFTFLASTTGQGAERDPHFEVRIERDGIPLPAVAAPIDLGGLRQQLTLQPGASHTFELDLGTWASLDQPGLYRIAATYSLAIEAPDARLAEPYDAAHLRWDAAATSACEIRVR